MNGNVLFYDESLKNENGLIKLLDNEGFNTIKVNEEHEFLALIENRDINLIIMNWNSNSSSAPSQNYDNIKELNNIRCIFPMPIIVSGHSFSDVDRIMAFNSGADDVISDEMNPLEMTARIKAHILRAKQLEQGRENNNIYKYDELVMDDNYRNVTVDGGLVSLTPVEYKILRLLLMNKGKIFTNDEIYTNIWRLKPINSNNTVAVHIRHIREKIERDPKNPSFLTSCWGSGYKVG